MDRALPSSLAAKLSEGRFVVTAELAPPRGADPAEALALADSLAGLADAFNVTDNQNARLRLSSLALSRLLLERGHEPVWQVTCRDRNRLALQSDMLGAWSLGVRNVLVLTGDHVTSGDHPDAAPVFDLDSIQLLAAVASLNAGSCLAGKPLKGAPAFFAGAALACEQEPRAMALARFRKKIRAGARFFQTQAVFDPGALAPFMEIAAGEGVHILAGVLLLHSAAMVDYINKKVPGLKVPEGIGKRIASAPDQVEAGLDVAAELMSRLRPSAHGLHLMTAGRDRLIPAMLSRAGLR